MMGVSLFRRRAGMKIWFGFKPLASFGGGRDPEVEEGNLMLRCQRVGDDFDRTSGGKQL